MRAAFVIFDGMTSLDFLGCFDAVDRLRSMKLRTGLECRLVAHTAAVRDGAGLEFHAHDVAPPLTDFDLVVVPGGMNTRTLVEDRDFIGWIASAAQVPTLASVCTGSLLLGAAGLLQGRTATTHPSAYKLLDQYAARVVDARIVDDGTVVSARGVTSSIDLGLYLTERSAGEAARRRIAEQMDYPYYDPSCVLSTRVT